ncbi:hypothetical protein PLESTF_001189600 [Pleodorina starrii]|nr:hypothetical protein PLESTF_001189600 [Pleodorina starrii]
MDTHRLAINRRCSALPQARAGMRARSAAFVFFVRALMLVSAAASRASYRRLKSEELGAELPVSAMASKDIYSGLEFVGSLLDANVGTMVLKEDLVLQDGDWVGVPTPLLLSRNVTVVGDSSEMTHFRIINFNWVARKIRLGNGVVFRMQRLVVLNYRLGNHNQAPGLDIFVSCSRGDAAEVETVDVMGVHRVCYPPEVQEESLRQITRPASIPGAQRYQAQLPPQPPGSCVNDTAASPRSRCWPHRGLYIDVGLLGADLYDYNRVQLTGYTVHMIRTVYLCDVLLSEACVQSLTALGCIQQVYAALNPPWQPLAAAAAAARQAAAAAGASERSPQLASQEVLPQPGTEESIQGNMQAAGPAAAAAADAGGRSLSREQKAGVGVGVAGGFVLLALSAIAVFFLWRRRRRRKPVQPLNAAGRTSQQHPWRPLCHDPPRLDSTYAAKGAEKDGKALGGGGGGDDPSTPQRQCSGNSEPSLSVATATATAAAATAVAEQDQGPGRLGTGAEAPPVAAQATASPEDAANLAGPAGRSTVAAGPGPAQLRKQGGGGDGNECGDCGGGGGDGFGAVSLAESRAVGQDSDGRSAAGTVEAVAPAAGDSPVVVTPLTPHRPDINLQLVLRNPISPPPPPPPPPPPAPSQLPQPPSPPAANSPATRNATRNATCNATTPDVTTFKSPGTATESSASAATATATAPTSTTPTSDDSNRDAPGCVPVEEVALIPGAVRGKGAFGRVVEGTYRGQRVAVKLMTGGGLGAGPGCSERLLKSFTHEVEVLARCCHPHVVRLLAACVSPPQLCLVMELMDTSLEAMIRNAPGRLLPMNAVLNIAVDIAKGLEYLHPTIVHRDIKPANVLVNDPLGPRQVAKLSDFGLARLHCSELRTKNPEAGTPAYMAPECFDVTVGTLTFHVDMYALGILLWVMLTGSQPWHGLNFMRLAFRVTYGQERPPLSAIPPGRRPPKLLRLISACWEADPRRRPAAAEAVKELMLVREMVARHGQESPQAGSETAAHIDADELCWRPHELSSPPPPPPQQQQPQNHQQPRTQLRCMAVFSALAAEDAARAAAVAAAATAAAASEAHEPALPPQLPHQHQRRAYEPRLHEQRLYEHAVLQRLAVGRLPQTLLQRQSSVGELPVSNLWRWQQQLEAQLLGPTHGADLWDPAMGVRDAPTLPQAVHNRHNRQSHQPPDQLQEHGQEQGPDQSQDQPRPQTRGQDHHHHQYHHHHHHHYQQPSGSGGDDGGDRFAASLDSSWRTALSLRFPGELTPGSATGGTALGLTIDGPA